MKSTNYVVVVGISTSCIIKMGQNDLNSQCRIVCAALSICPHYEKESASCAQAYASFVYKMFKQATGTMILLVYVGSIVI